MSSAQLAVFAGPRTVRNAAGVEPWLLCAEPSNGSWLLDLRKGDEASLCATSARGAALFNGVLYNRRELATALDAPLDGSDADLVWLAYERWHSDFPRHLNGIFALVVAAAEDGELIAVRDPLGAFPLFYACTGDGLALSTSIDVLRTAPNINTALNRAALADHLCHRWPDVHETFFAAIRRVPPGYALRATAGRVAVSRYWDPVPAGQPISWIAERDLIELFGARLEQAVERRVAGRRSGIFLSGGLDSISVGAIAADVARRDASPLPLALSLGFPGEAGEELEQRGVAAALGLKQEFVPFEDATPSHGLLQSALDATRLQPAPLLNTWMPAYTHLALLGRAQGVRTILSGAGGDEWLSVSPFLAADLIRRRDTAGLRRLIRGWRQSYTLPYYRMLRSLLWTYGTRPLAAAAIEGLAPHAWKANRVGRLARATFPWVAPNRALRTELHARIERNLPSSNPAEGFYFRDIRASLEHPLTPMELEETFEMGRRLDVRFLHPFWDADVVDLLYRTPPLLLFSGGRSKSVVRDTMARRFPGLGLETQKKRAGTSFYRAVLDREIPELWRRNSDLSALGDLGIVNPRSAASMAAAAIESRFGTGLVRTWDLMNVETWVRAHN